ncbi:pleckstrin homology domain-containing family A member 8-like [Rhipicephalus microplus]|uniref:pleckstrin homology domain-containing family A member 8-like n=1 Tax=Rhipicephalus microplus TaxID=6941 RepID=UPI003F6C25AA
MEGVLWKWTNYWNGWQPRWFILDKGILTYYKSQDEVNQGCKGSVKVSACEIVVHPTDNRRLDLVIPSEQHFYLRAPTPSERQQWLVALGSSKAATAAAGSHAVQPIRLGGGGGDPEGGLRAKKAELRLYCDLLMQQVHTIKTSQNGGEEEAAKAAEAADLLRATCDTFIATLEDCMHLADANFTYELPHQEVRDSALPHETPPLVAPVVPKSLQSAHPSSRRRRKSNSISSSSTTPGAASSAVSMMDSTRQQHGQRADHNTDAALNSPGLVPSSATSPGCTSTSSLSSAATNHVTSPVDLVPLPGSAELSDHESSPALNGSSVASVNHPSPVANGNLLNHLGRPHTFFSVMEHSFNDLSPATGIPTEQFLNSCRSILAVFDVLGSTAFVPVKMDIQGNIGKLQARYETDPSNFDQLFDMVRQEIDSGANTARNSVTDALLWLSRALAFIHAFLEQIQSGNAVLADCASVAYATTLKCHHGWVVRSIFAVALRAMPELEPFIEAMAPSAEDLQHPDYRRQLFADGGAYVQALQEVLDALNNFYVQNGLEPPVQKS